jgi:hypothetical protein
MPATDSEKTGLDEFFGLLKDVQKIALVAAGGLIALPLIAGLGGFTPPWPPGVVGITTLVELVVLMVVFQVLAKAPRSKATRVIVCSAVLVFVFSVTYLVLNAAFVYQIPNNDTRVVMGCGLSENAKIILKSDGQNPTDVCPGEFALLLSSAQYETDKVWTRFSVAALKAALATSWLASFAALAALVGVFVAYQRKQATKRPRATKQAV